MIRLTLTDEQAQILAKACEFYARVRYGQFEEILWSCIEFKGAKDDVFYQRDMAKALLFEARKYIYPELHGPGHSYGLGDFEDADTAYDIYQVVRMHFGDDRKPFSYNPLPICERVKENED